MKKIFYSDIAAIPPTVCPSSLDENLKPVDPNNTAHRRDDTTDPITCAECGTEQDNDLCECGNPSPTTPENTYGDNAHAPNCPTRCDGYACAYGCGTCFCPCHD